MSRVVDLKSKLGIGKHGDPSFCPERQLWASVLYAVVHDLCGSVYSFDRQAAERWVGEFPGRDFREVCDLAGLDSDAVWERLHKICQTPPAERVWEEAWATRSEAIRRNRRIGQRW